jgi:hypothetical protein
MSWEFSISDIYFILVAIAVAVLFVVLRRHLREAEHPELVLFCGESWKKIENLVENGHELNYKLAVIEADKLLEHVLVRLKYPGVTLADKLRVAQIKKPRLKKVWWAHKVRNCVVHDVKYVLKYGETKKILATFKNALKELNCL